MIEVLLMFLNLLCLLNKRRASLRVVGPLSDGGLDLHDLGMCQLAAESEGFSQAGNAR